MGELRSQAEKTAMDSEVPEVFIVAREAPCWCWFECCGPLLREWCIVIKWEQEGYLHIQI